MKRYLKILISLICLLMIGSILFLKNAHKNQDALNRAPICISDNEVFTSFCKLAAENEKEFGEFKRSPIFNLVHEQATYEEGHNYLVQIISKYPVLLEKLDVFRKNDQLGGPLTYEYPFVGNFSPTTLRYMKVAGDLQSHFGSLKGLKVLEIGGGYGGQFQILSGIYDFQSYTILDLPESLRLAKKYLNMQGLGEKVRFCTLDEISDQESFDLIISNYSFTEYNRELQKQLIRKIFKNSKKGYLTCNFYPKHFGVKSLPKEQILKAIGQLRFEIEEHCEEPLTGKDNFILVWKTSN